MHTMVWNGITDQEAFMGFVEDLKRDPEPTCNYKQAARLFLNGTIVGKPDRCVMVALQVPTSAGCEDGRPDGPWLDAFEVNSMGDYSESDQLFSLKECEITYENAERQMLALAKDICD